jgi:chemotaxis response regulator CheB
MLKKYPEIKLVGEAENGKELIDIVGKLKPDVIFTDIKMPVMDGIEATKQLLKKTRISILWHCQCLMRIHSLWKCWRQGAKGIYVEKCTKR